MLDNQTPASPPLLTATVNSQNPETAASTAMAPVKVPTGLKFGPFAVTSQVFHVSRSQLSYGLVNLKPLLPGHVLVCPTRAEVARLSQLSAAETADLFDTVRVVSRTLERVYAATAFNVAVQDGVDAGQSVPHVHVHVIPRHGGDYSAKGGGDRIYDDMDGEDVGNLGAAFVEMQRRRLQRPSRGMGGPDSDRKPRTEDEMRREAEWLYGEMQKDLPQEEREEA